MRACVFVRDMEEEQAFWEVFANIPTRLWACVRVRGSARDCARAESRICGRVR